MRGTGVIVAIDGPAGAGKSTIARGVADALGFARVDTGAIYRAVTLASLEAGLTEEADIVARMRALDLRIDEAGVFVDGRDVTSAIRSAEVTAATSRVSAMAGVRSHLLEMQRAAARRHPRGAVLEGRDIGTVVFPDADVKVFLTASPEERARRRTLEIAKTGAPADFDEVLAAIRERDRKDTERPVAPLRQAEDAIPVDSTHRTAPEVIVEIAALVRTVAPH